jgi:hypothetical protein
MKSRLGTSAARNKDSLDKIVALAEQKEEQGERLEELRQQRKEEEEKRQREIALLRQQAHEKLAEQVNIDLAKYEKVASSKYAGDLKNSAWKAMVANYPEARKVKVGDVDRFLFVLGLIRNDDEVITTEESLNKATYTDPNTGLMWTRQDNGKDINWADAKAYCKNYRVGGFTDWRMPTLEEMVGLYENSPNNNEIKVSGWVWAIEISGSDAAIFSFINGARAWDPKSYNSDNRALPVRSVK